MNSAQVEGPVELFSSPLEVGFRALFLLSALNAPADLQRLVIFDYFTVHSADVDGPQSLHPPTPHRGAEILVKRDVLRRGLLLMISRGLLSMHTHDSGLVYASTEVTKAFLLYFQSSYAQSLSNRAAWVANRFGSLSDD